MSFVGNGIETTCTHKVIWLVSSRHIAYYTKRASYWFYVTFSTHEDNAELCCTKNDSRSNNDQDFGAFGVLPQKRLKNLTSKSDCIENIIRLPLPMSRTRRHNESFKNNYYGIYIMEQWRCLVLLSSEHIFMVLDRILFIVYTA